ncbi:metallophosphoesterase [Priestia flexa]|uniref:metallophosphoesterase n=1 Tax=Priestia flexa TaxID=86664 RepID=UPI00240D11CB|nr:metallophosphoesterase [Priestia flexa]WEZ09734.1 metallophosphoesterase family protein [Priestia flexa]
MIMIIGIIGVLVVAAIVLLTYMAKEAQRTVVEQEHIEVKGVPKEWQSLRIFFISDIHKRTVTKSLIEQVKGHIDFVVIGGDLAEKGVSLQQIEANIKQLRQLGSIYFVWGNNDYEINQQSLAALFKKHEVVALKNEAICIEKEGVSYNIVGVDDLSEGHLNINQAYNGVNQQHFTLLLSHNPDAVFEVEKQRVDLMLSGHTHGGQIRLLGFGPYELGGLKTHKDIVYFVSNGYGTTSLPLRLEAKAKAHVLTITRAN